MSSDFDKMVNQMQEKIIDDMRKVYSEKVIELFLHPENTGEIKDAEGYGKFTGPCGDTMEIYLRFGELGRIREATFMTDGCGPSVACGSMLTSLVRGLSSEKALSISAQDLLSALKGLPEESAHCAELAVNTLRAAISNWKNRDSR